MPGSQPSPGSLPPAVPAGWGAHSCPALRFVPWVGRVASSIPPELPPSTSEAGGSWQPVPPAPPILHFYVRERLRWQGPLLIYPCVCSG